MNAVFDPKKTCNVNVDGHLVREAKPQAWNNENRNAIEARHRWVEENGLLSDHFRMF